MKRISILLLSSALLLSSCHTLTKTARTADVGTSLQSATVVDLVPATEQRITHTIEPTKDILRGGMDNVRQAVIHEALVEKGNNADVLLEPQYVVSKKKTLFGSKITSITVSGRPAYYTNFRVLDDSVWCNPVFRGVNMHQCSLPLVGMKSPIQKKKSNDSYTPAYRTKGFAMYLTPFIGYGEFNCEHYNASGTAFAAFLSLGYQLNPYLYFGVGAGVNGMGTTYNDYYSHLRHTDLRGTYMPLFANARINFSKKRNTLFVDGKLIYSLVGDTRAVGAGNGLFDQVGGSFALGYSFGNIDVAFQYILWGNDYCEYEVRHYHYGGYYSWSSDNEEIDFSQYGISIGFRF